MASGLHSKSRFLYDAYCLYIVSFYDLNSFAALTKMPEWVFEVDLECVLGSLEQAMSGGLTSFQEAVGEG